MILIRRRSYVLPIAILIFFIIVLFLGLSPGAETPYTYDATEYYVSEYSKNDNGIHWTKHPEQYPLSEYIPLPTAAPSPIPRVQYDFPRESWFEWSDRARKQKAVKKAFKHAWNGYKRHAWLHDELSPLSGGYRETFAGWAATLVDSLDTLLIMGMEDEFEDALRYLDLIDFTTTNASQINVFETVIRYLGGLLGAYDLSNGTYPILLKKATEVADFVYDSFDTPNRMPQSRWQWTRSAQGLGILPSRNTILAELGSLNLEFTRLSQLTKDPKYFDAIQRITDILEDAQKRTKVPGMWPMMVNAQELEFFDFRFTIGGMADSTYEYLPKAHMLLGAQTNQYRNMYNAAMEAIKKHLLFRPMTKDGQDILFAGNKYTGGVSANAENPEPQMEHLKCFFGGTVGIGAKVLGRPEDLSIARKLTDGCIWAYDIMPTGIMPEILYLSACENIDKCEWDEKRWYRDVLRRAGRSKLENDPREAEAVIKTKGLQPGVTNVADATYKLRPEAIESVFIMYRITGDKTLQDAAWRMFRNIEKMTRTKYAHAAIEDVRDPDSEQTDYMESFWLAETLKYFYLIFSDPDVVNLDEYVLNTEAHPFKRPTDKS